MEKITKELLKLTKYLHNRNKLYNQRMNDMFPFIEGEVDLLDAACEAIWRTAFDTIGVRWEEYNYEVWTEREQRGLLKDGEEEFVYLEDKMDDIFFDYIDGAISEKQAIEAAVKLHIKAFQRTVPLNQVELAERVATIYRHLNDVELKFDKMFDISIDVVDYDKFYLQDVFYEALGYPKSFYMTHVAFQDLFWEMVDNEADASETLRKKKQCYEEWVRKNQ